MNKMTALGSLFRILLLTGFLYGLIHDAGDSVWDYFIELKKVEDALEVVLHSLLFGMGLLSSLLSF